jgi:phytoene dehydrogenase-like protein
VLSSIHVKDLIEMAPPDAWGPDFLYGIETLDPGVPAFATHYATSEPPQYRQRDGGELTAVSAGVAGWPEQIVRMGRDVKEGRLVRDGAWLLFPTPTGADPSRAPAGMHTVKVLGVQPYDPGGGPERWNQLREEIAAIHLAHLRRAAPNLVEETILDELIVAPPDLERSNPHMWHGTFHGGDRSLAHSGALRPAPGWAQHRMPIAGLYQTGGTTHPGGSVTGGPGRNAAIVMLTDFGDDPREVMTDARRAGAGRR